MKQLNQKQKDFIEENCESMTDGQIAKKIKMTYHQVRYYRYSKAGIAHYNYEVDKEPIREELNALEVFKISYSGCMLESLNKRINHLKSIL